MNDDPITPDDLATGAIIRALALRVARLEAPDSVEDAFDDIRERTVEAIGDVPIFGATAASAIRIRAHAQIVVQRLLEPAGR